MMDISAMEAPPPPGQFCEQKTPPSLPASPLGPVSRYLFICQEHVPSYVGDPRMTAAESATYCSSASSMGMHLASTPSASQPERTSSAIFAVFPVSEW